MLCLFDIDNDTLIQTHFTYIVIGHHPDAKFSLAAWHQQNRQLGVLCVPSLSLTQVLHITSSATAGFPLLVPHTQYQNVKIIYCKQNHQ